MKNSFSEELIKQQIGLSPNLKLQLFKGEKDYKGISYYALDGKRTVSEKILSEVKPLN